MDYLPVEMINLSKIIDNHVREIFTSVLPLHCDAV